MPNNSKVLVAGREVVTCVTLIYRIPSTTCQQNFTGSACFYILASVIWDGYDNARSLVCSVTDEDL